MAQPQREQRSTRRFSLKLPVTVKFNEAGVEKTAHTRDVSARGICFNVDSPIEEGAEIEFTLTLPPEITMTESIHVRCKGRVVRADEPGPSGELSIAAVIDEYEFLSGS